MTTSPSAQEIVLDVRELLPPEPLERAVNMLQQVQAGQYIRMIHRKEPCLLYPILQEQGWVQRTIKRSDGMVEIIIWRKSDPVFTEWNEQIGYTT